MDKQNSCKALMILGTSSSVGKTVIVTALCRLFSRKGYRVAPFKSQNMSSFSFHLADGGEISRAQAMQAEAAGRIPDPRMNPILLKPRSDHGSEVIVMGKSRENLEASDYYREKKKLWPEVRAAYESLAAENDLIFVEGAGSPAEINLLQDDFVNLGLAHRLQIPCLLVGDIDRGGVFASLYGTLSLLPEEQRPLLKGMLINKFRGDLRLLEPGIAQLEALCGLPLLGVLPWMRIDLEEEDSLSAAARGKESAGRGADAARAAQPAERESDPQPLRQAAFDRLADLLEENLKPHALERLLDLE